MTITMSKRQLDRYEIINRLIRKEINGITAANLLSLSVRHTKRLKVKVKEKGPQGLIHARKGRPSNNQIGGEEKNKIVSLLRKHYYDFGPTFAAEKLSELHGFTRDPKTIRIIMIAEELWKPKPKRKKQPHRSWRERKASYGEMQQFDGSYEYWFEDRGTECCLLAAIDDATGKITKAKFDTDEGVFPVFGFWKEYLEQNGQPRTVYLDKFSTYKMSQKTAQNNHNLLTQFQRAADEIHMELITAHSPEAKGRVERLFNTLQDRLIKELRLAGISTIVQANIFLDKIFIPKFNQQFNVQPRNKIDLHQKLSMSEMKKLESVFSRQTKRVVQNDFTLSFHNQWYQLTKDQVATVQKKDEVLMEERIDGSIHIRLRGKYLNYALLPERPKKQKQPWILAANQRAVYIPPPDHPWRRKFTLPAPAGRCQTSSHPPNAS